MAEPVIAKGGRVSQAGEVRSARVESLRAVAALAVMLGHAYAAANLWGGAAPEGLVTTLFYGGAFGVFLFFALSGYLLFWPFVKRDFADAGQIDLRRYATNRALRILPLYYVSIVVVLLAQHGGGSLREWVMFTTFSQNYSVDTIASVNGVLWSLVVEVHFYLLLPLLAVAIARLSRGSLVSAAALLAGLAVLSMAVRYEKVPAEANTALLWRFSLPTTFFYFVSGMLLALLRLAWERRAPQRLPEFVRSSSSWLSAAAAVWLLQFFYEEWFALAAIASFLTVGACVLPLRDGPLVRGLEWKPLALLGVASYSLYVWHIPILQEIAGPLTAPRGPYNEVTLIAAVVPLCLAVALISYRLVEAPFLSLRKRWTG